MSEFDVYSFGVVSSSTLYRLEQGFPPPEGYAEITEVQTMAGGEATNSSICLSRLGTRVRLDGNWIGDDDNGRRLKDLLTGYRIDTTRLPLTEGYTGASEVVFSASGSRTIFGTYGRLLTDACWNMPREDDIRQARAVCLDPFFGEASLHAAELGAGAGVPVITVDCCYDAPLLRHASAVVIAESFVRDQYPGQDPDELFRAYQRSCRGLVVFTSGEGPIRYVGPEAKAQTFRPFPVEPVDTSGAGDSFRAGIVYGFLNRWDTLRTIEFATALAAMVCMRSPGVLDAPELDEVREFIGGHPGSQSG